MLAGISYVPLLHSKRAEIKAIEKLDDFVKDNIFFIIVMRPWPNAGQLSAMIEKIDAVIGNRRFALDLDESKFNVASDLDAQEQFNQLFSPNDSFSNYYRMIESLSGAVPVLQVKAVEPHIGEQFEKVDALGRGVVIRIERDKPDILDQVFQHAHVDDTLFAVDVGWQKDVLQQEMWASQIISRITDWNENAEISCLSSSFPDSFNHIEHRGSFTIDDRELFNRLRQRNNIADLIYGDWGSTRKSNEGGGGTPPARIDLAGDRDWTSYRITGPERTYREIATRAVADDGWSDVQDCWGKYSIECTALGVPNGIRGTEGAALSRINLHLTVQSQFGDEAVDVPDQPFVDNF
ncbi:MAG: hypothetical protein Q7T60_09565 [Sphingopyxis sp.]|nr:hypothetical protein [Sphingopyxis sp.]